MPQPTKSAPPTVEIGGPSAPVPFDSAEAESLRQRLLADRAAPPFRVIATPVTEATPPLRPAFHVDPHPTRTALKALGLPAVVLIMIVALIVSLIALNHGPFDRGGRGRVAPTGRPPQRGEASILRPLADAASLKPPASTAGGPPPAEVQAQPPNVGLKPRR